MDPWSSNPCCSRINRIYLGEGYWFLIRLRTASLQPSHEVVVQLVLSHLWRLGSCYLWRQLFASIPYVEPRWRTLNSCTHGWDLSESKCCYPGCCLSLQKSNALFSLKSVVNLLMRTSLKNEYCIKLLASSLHVEKEASSQLRVEDSQLVSSYLLIQCFSASLNPSNHRRLHPCHISPSYW